MTLELNIRAKEKALAVKEKSMDKYKGFLKPGGLYHTNNYTFYDDMVEVKKVEMTLAKLKATYG